MNVVYLVFGDEQKNHIQTYFSLLTFAKAKEINTINVITDRAELYDNLKEIVNIIPISESDLKEWKGEYDFFWRIKIKAISLIVDRYKEQNILYIDSDTFLFSDNMKEIENMLNKGLSLMHLNEGNLCKLRTKTEKRMWRQMKNKTFAGVEVTEQSCMWNAGVISFCGKNGKQLIDLTLNICDEMLKAGVTRRLIEQFSFSLALDALTKMTPAENWIGHYWANKAAWNNLATKFLLDSYFQKKTIKKQIEELGSFDFHTIPTSKKELKERKAQIRKHSNIFTRIESLIKKSV